MDKTEEKLDFTPLEDEDEMIKEAEFLESQRDEIERELNEADREFLLGMMYGIQFCADEDKSHMMESSHLSDEQCGFKTEKLDTAILMKEYQCYSCGHKWSTDTMDTSQEAKHEVRCPKCGTLMI